MGQVNMSVDMGGFTMKNPVNTASGAFGFGYQFEGFFDVSTLGAITLKGCSAVPWPGNPAPRMCEIPSGMLNTVGLANPGIKALAQGFGEYFQELEAKDTRVIAQIAGHSIDECIQATELYEELMPYVSALELNISCPNLEAGGRPMGDTPEAAEAVVSAVRKHTDRPLLVKLAPRNVADISRACESAGADGLTLINTIPAMSIDIHTHRSKISRATGGASGPCIHAIAVRMVWEAAQAVSIPICGAGGIMSGADAAEFILAGATSVAVGMGNFAQPDLAPRVLAELEQWAEGEGVEDISELRGAFQC